MSGAAATIGKVMVDPNSPASTRVQAAETTRTYGPKAIALDDIEARVAWHETVR
jgi:hypothetical protein